MTDITYLTNNWVNGMKITQKHFINTDNALLDGLRDCRVLALGSFYYGILPIGNSNTKNFDAEINVIGESLTVKVNICKAVTSNGERIDIFKPIQSHSSVNELIKYLNLDSLSYNIYIVIQIDSFNRVPFGEVLKDETPTREPFSVPNYKIDFVTTENFKMNATVYNKSFVIGKIRISNRILSKIPYLPPCMTVSSIQELQSKYLEIHKNIKSILNVSVGIVKDIRTYDIFTSELFARGAKYLAEATMQYIISNFSKIEVMGLNFPPINIITFGIELLTIHFYTVNSLSQEEQTEFQMVRQGMQNHHLYSLDKYSELTTEPYNHDDIYISFEKLNDTLRNLLFVYQKYAEHLKDLDFRRGRRTQETKNPYTNQTDMNEPPSQDEWRF